MGEHTIMEIKRYFVRVGDRQVHYRRVGNGPPFVVFHVSPQDSSFVIPQLLPLANRYTLIGLDTPGYGESDPLRNSSPTMADYADAVRETLDALGIDRTPVYGSHTGANIAVELARRAPERIAAVILDGLSLSTPEVAKDRIDHYAPLFTPTADGAHLAWAWQHTRDQLIFWPWYESHQANRLTIDMKDPDYLHDVVMSKMYASSYWLGYRAAFGHDSRDALKQLSVPTFFVTPDSDAHMAIERSLSDLPENIYFEDTNEKNQLDAIAKALSKVIWDKKTLSPPAFKASKTPQRDYVSIDGGQRLVQRISPYSDSADDKTLVLLHGGMRTSALLMETAKAVSIHRPVLAIDIAGNGNSDSISTHTLEAYAADVRETLAACGVDDFDLYGESIGASLALELANQTQGHGNGIVRKLILDRPELPDSETRASLIECCAPPIEARWDGTHFLTAWNILRDTAMFWPWYNTTEGGIRHIEPDIEPIALQTRLLAWLKGRITYGDYIRSAYSVDTMALLPRISQSTLIISQCDDVIESHAIAAKEEMPSAKLISTPFQRPPISAIEAFLTK